MNTPPISTIEDSRLADLESYEILETRNEECYTFLTKMAAEICHVPIATISIVDENRHWFKSHHGINTTEISRKSHFFEEALKKKKDVFIVNDARTDDRFKTNPLIIENHTLIFYAGVTLLSTKGNVLGLLSVIDDEPHELTHEQIETLKSLAKQVSQLFELNKLNIEVEKSQKLLTEIAENYKIRTWELSLASNKIIFSDNAKENTPSSSGYDDIFNGNAIHQPENIDQKNVIELINTAAQTGEEFDEERRFISLKKSEMWVRVLIKTEKRIGKKSLIYGTIQDITKRKLADKETIYQSTLMDGLFELSPLGIALNDLSTGTYLALNDKLIEPTGYTKEEFVKLSYWDVTPKEYAPLEEIALQQMTELGHYKTFQKEYIRKDGTRYPIELRGVVVEDAEGNKKIWSFVEDISERVENEKKLRLSEETFRGSFDYAGIGMALISEEGKWLRVNKNLAEMLGYTIDEFLNINFQSITHPNDVNSDLELLKQLSLGEIDHYQIEKRYQHKLNHYIHAILSVSVVKDDQNKIQHFISQFVDITEAKTSELRLKELLSKNQALLDASKEVTIIGTNKKGIIQTFNRGAENFLGYKMDELINKQSPAILHKEEEVIARSKELTQLNGRTIQGFEVFTFDADRLGHDVREWTYRHKNGKEFTVLLNITPIISEGETIGYLGIGTDITAIKKADKELKAILTLTKHQNERLQNFAYIVSHNLRSHSGNLARLLKMFLKDHPKLEELKITQMLNLSAKNLRDTVSNLSEVALIQDSSNEEFYPVPLQESIANAINIVTTLAMEKEVEIINEVDPILSVIGINAYVDSILLNFLTNGINYRSEDRKSFVKLSAKIENEYIVLSIKDNGLGIDLVRHKNKLFGMYKTFHKNEQARGLGLFITKNQIEALGGFVEVKSKVDKGTTFKIYFKQ